MANVLNNKFIPRRVAAKYKTLVITTSKLQKRTSSIGFIKKAVHNEVTPKFATVKGQFLNTNDKWKCEKQILISHLQDHVITVKELVRKYNILVEEMIIVIEEKLMKVSDSITFSYILAFL